MRTRQRFHTPVRGHRFAPTRAAAVTSPGRLVCLQAEMSNPVDPDAIAVEVADETNGYVRIGYVERPVAARVHAARNEGHEVRAVVAGWWPDPSGTWRRPVIRIDIR